MVAHEDSDPSVSDELPEPHGRRLSGKKAEPEGGLGMLDEEDGEIKKSEHPGPRLRSSSSGHGVQLGKNKGKGQGLNIVAGAGRSSGVGVAGKSSNLDEATKEKMVKDMEKTELRTLVEMMTASEGRMLREAELSERRMLDAATYSEKKMLAAAEASEKKIVKMAAIFTAIAVALGLSAGALSQYMVVTTEKTTYAGAARTDINQATLENEEGVPFATRNTDLVPRSGQLALVRPALDALFVDVAQARNDTSSISTLLGGLAPRELEGLAGAPPAMGSWEAMYQGESAAGGGAETQSETTRMLTELMSTGHVVSSDGRVLAERNTGTIAAASAAAPTTGRRNLQNQITGEEDAPSITAIATSQATTEHILTTRIPDQYFQALVSVTISLRPNANHGGGVLPTVQLQVHEFSRVDSLTSACGDLVLLYTPHGVLTLDDHHASVDNALENYLVSSRGLGAEFLGNVAAGSSAGVRTARGRRLASATVAMGRFTQFGGFTFVCTNSDPPAAAGPAYMYVARREFACGSYEAEQARAQGIAAVPTGNAAPSCASRLEGVPYKPGVETGEVPQDGRNRKAFVEERVFGYMGTEIVFSTYPNHPLQMLVEVKNQTHHKRYQVVNNFGRGYNCLLQRRERSTFERAMASGADLSGNFRVTYLDTLLDHRVDPAGMTVRKFLVQSLENANSGGLARVLSRKEHRELTERRLASAPVDETVLRARERGRRLTSSLNTGEANARTPPEDPNMERRATLEAAVEYLETVDLTTGLRHPYRVELPGAMANLFDAKQIMGWDDNFSAQEFVALAATLPVVDDHADCHGNLGNVASFRRAEQNRLGMVLPPLITDPLEESMDSLLYYRNGNRLANTDASTGVETFRASAVEAQYGPYWAQVMDPSANSAWARTIRAQQGASVQDIDGDGGNGFRSRRLDRVAEPHKQKLKLTGEGSAGQDATVQNRNRGWIRPQSEEGTDATGQNGGRTAVVPSDSYSESSRGMTRSERTTSFPAKPTVVPDQRPGSRQKRRGSKAQKRAEQKRRSRERVLKFSQAVRAHLEYVRDTGRSPRMLQHQARRKLALQAQGFGVSQEDRLRELHREQEAWWRRKMEDGSADNRARLHGEKSKATRPDLAGAQKTVFLPSSDQHLLNTALHDSQVVYKGRSPTRRARESLPGVNPFVTPATGRAPPAGKEQESRRTSAAVDENEAWTPQIPDSKIGMILYLGKLAKERLSQPMPPRRTTKGSTGTGYVDNYGVPREQVDKALAPTSSRELQQTVSASTPMPTANSTEIEYCSRLLDLDLGSVTGGLIGNSCDSDTVDGGCSIAGAQDPFSLVFELCLNEVKLSFGSPQVIDPFIFWEWHAFGTITVRHELIAIFTGAWEMSQALVENFRDLTQQFSQACRAAAAIPFQSTVTPEKCDSFDQWVSQKSSGSDNTAETEVALASDTPEAALNPIKSTLFGIESLTGPFSAIQSLQGTLTATMAQLTELLSLFSDAKALLHSPPEIDGELGLTGSQFYGYDDSAGTGLKIGCGAGAMILFGFQKQPWTIGDWANEQISNMERKRLIGTYIKEGNWDTITVQDLSANTMKFGQLCATPPQTAMMRGLRRTVYKLDSMYTNDMETHPYNYFYTGPYYGGRAPEHALGDTGSGEWQGENPHIVAAIDCKYRGEHRYKMIKFDGIMAGPVYLRFEKREWLGGAEGALVAEGWQPWYLANGRNGANQTQWGSLPFATTASNGWTKICPDSAGDCRARPARFQLVMPACGENDGYTGRVLLKASSDLLAPERPMTYSFAAMPVFQTASGTDYERFTTDSAQIKPTFRAESDSADRYPGNSLAHKMTLGPEVVEKQFFTGSENCPGSVNGGVIVSVPNVNHCATDADCAQFPGCLLSPMIQLPLSSHVRCMSGTCMRIQETTAGAGTTHSKYGYASSGGRGHVAAYPAPSQLHMDDLSDGLRQYRPVQQGLQTGTDRDALPSEPGFLQGVNTAENYPADLSHSWYHLCLPKENTYFIDYTYRPSYHRLICSVYVPKVHTSEPGSGLHATGFTFHGDEFKTAETRGQALFRVSIEASLPESTLLASIYEPTNFKIVQPSSMTVEPHEDDPTPTAYILYAEAAVEGTCAAVVPILGDVGVDLEAEGHIRIEAGPLGFWQGFDSFIIDGTLTAKVELDFLLISATGELDITFGTQYASGEWNSEELGFETDYTYDIVDSPQELFQIALDKLWGEEGSPGSLADCNTLWFQAAIDACQGLFIRRGLTNLSPRKMNHLLPAGRSATGLALAAVLSDTDDEDWGIQHDDDVDDEKSKISFGGVAPPDNSASVVYYEENHYFSSPAAASDHRRALSWREGGRKSAKLPRRHPLRTHVPRSSAWRRSLLATHGEGYRQKLERADRFLEYLHSGRSLDPAERQSYKSFSARDMLRAARPLLATNGLRVMKDSYLQGLSAVYAAAGNATHPLGRAVRRMQEDMVLKGKGRPRRGLYHSADAASAGGRGTGREEDDQQRQLLTGNMDYMEVEPDDETLSDDVVDKHTHRSMNEFHLESLRAAVRRTLRRGKPEVLLGGFKEGA
eukprot:g10946.t1